MPDYGNAEAAGAIYVIARAFGFDAIADAAYDAQREEIDEGYGRSLDPWEIGDHGVAERIAEAMERTTPSLKGAIGELNFALAMHLAAEQKRAVAIEALRAQRDALRNSLGDLA